MTSSVKDMQNVNVKTSMKLSFSMKPVLTLQMLITILLVRVRNACANISVAAGITSVSYIFVI